VKIALATCTQLPEPDADEELLVHALEARGATVRLLPWDASECDAAPGELVVLRSTWNYFREVDRFLAWVDRTAERTPIFNPAALVRTNARKTYLRDLAERGVPIVPTEYVDRWKPRELEPIVGALGAEAIVIKPVVSAGSFLTKRFDRDQMADADRFLRELAAERDVMVQRWMPEVETYGERSLVWIDGAFTHAIRKSPRFSGDAENVSSEVPMTPAERAFGESVVAPLAKDILYARVDTIDDAGTLRLMELELIEPSLFLRQSPPALERFVHAIVRRART
jgi:glutathione synthase/RimK-type ligase-like ATP-grasp enzyme